MTLTMTPGVRLLVAAIWLASGLVASIIMMRRGHRHWSWVLIGMLLGPLAGLVFRGRVEAESPHVAHMRLGRDGLGLHVLLGIDGSMDSIGAANAALGLLAGAVGRVTLATVVDFDTAEDAGGEADLAAQSRLRSVAGTLERWNPDEVVLAGPAVGALLQFATEQDVDIIVVGPRGRGVGHRLLGSVCSGLVSHARIPVLVIGNRSSEDRDPHQPPPAAKSGERRRPRRVQ